MKKILGIICLFASFNSLADTLTLRYSTGEYTGLDLDANHYQFTYGGQESDGDDFLFSYLYGAESGAEHPEDEIVRHDFQYLNRDLKDNYYVLSGYRAVYLKDVFNEGDESEEGYGLFYEYGYGAYWEVGSGHGFIANATVGLGVGYLEEEFFGNEKDEKWIVGITYDAAFGYNVSIGDGGAYIRYRALGIPGSEANMHGPEIGVSFRF
ncbi:hypothetical protein [Alteromonas hispanica]|uniref:Outer membrane beta-barrel protein n=1 Tax=Alteromonas hispanica TaxID=315421 RepID=A0A6L9MSJ6_9ALTE|nr:hypothetical protein [Alteromonas hispanica]NDW21184.1 hypothetical protein [Alteromonas hispanica]